MGAQDQSQQLINGRYRMNIVELAREAGMLVLLDARIGGSEYQSVSGSVQSLQRFVDAVLASDSDEIRARKSLSDFCGPRLDAMPR
jgi:hypothetical protein